MNNLNSTQQSVIMSFFAPIIVTEKREPRYYTRQETADKIHVTLPTLARLTKEGLIESKRIGSRILYDADAIDRAVKEQVVFKYRRG